MKVFISGNIADSGIKILEQHHISISCWKEPRQISPQELISACQAADAFISVGPNKIDSEFLHACKHLKVIALHSVGYNNVDMDTAKSLNIPIGNTPGVLSGATADTAFLLMLAASRKAFHLHKKIVNGAWKAYEPTTEMGVELNGKTLGIFGLGNIGLEMAKKCVGAYGMEVIYHNRHSNEQAAKIVNATYVSFDELVEKSDVLSVHTALTPETSGKFDLSVFKKMKPGAIFINTARGAIHKEDDLIEALNRKFIWGAGLDVSNPEPMQADNPLLRMETVAVLPHIGSATYETRNAMAILVAGNVLAGLKGEKLPSEVK